MNFKIVYTDHFEREFKRLAKKYRSIKYDLANLLNQLEENPTTGTPLGKDCYKVRLAISAKQKGKSAGARVITHLHIQGKTIFLLSIYDKSEQESISDNEISAILNQIK